MKCSSCFLWALLFFPACAVGQQEGSPPPQEQREHLDVLHKELRLLEERLDAMHREAEAERSEVAEGMTANLISSLQEYRDLDQSRRYGQEMWKPIFWLLIFILFFELWLERRMARRRRSV